MLPELISIPIDRIDPDLNNPRTTFNDDTLEDLSGSIRNYGVLQPILVTKSRDANDRFQLVAGERRWRAAQLAGQLSIPALVVSYSVSDLQEIQVVENLDREPLNIIDEAEAFQKLKQRGDYSDHELARRFHKSMGFIRSRLDLLHLSEEARRIVITNRIGLTVALIVSRIANAEDQVNILELVSKGEWSAAQTQDYIRRQDVQKRSDQARQNKLSELQRKLEALKSQGFIVLTEETFTHDQHRRTWDMSFTECKSCDAKGRFLRNDSQVEEACVKADCFRHLTNQQRSTNVSAYNNSQKEREHAFASVLKGEHITLQHLHYMLWTQLSLLGSASAAWLAEYPQTYGSNTESGTNALWTVVCTLNEEQLLTEILRLTVSYMAQLNNANLPPALKQSLIQNFNMPPHIFQISEERNTNEIA